MGRIVDHNSATKAIATSQITTFTSSDVPGSSVVAFNFGMTGAGNTLNALDRIRVSANGVPFYNISIPQYRAFIQRMTAGKVAYPPNTAVPPPPGAAATPVDWSRFSIPFCFIDREKSEEADVCQFPVGSQPTIELVFNANAVAGTVKCGWTLTDVDAACYPKLYGNQMTIGASQANGRYGFAEDGAVRAFILETTGNARTRLVLNGRQVYHMFGQLADNATVNENSGILEAEMLFGGRSYSALAGTAFSDNSIVDPACVKVTSPDDATPGQSFIELTTTAAWSGNASELGIYAVVAYPKQATA